MDCIKCRSKMKVMKTISQGNRTYRAYKCRECGEYRYSEEKCMNGAKSALSKVCYEKLKKSIEK